MLEIRPFRASDETNVVALWHRCGLTRPWNDPAKDIARKLSVQPEMFLVALLAEDVVGSVMVGYDGHRGWMYYLGVDPDYQRKGVGRALVEQAERTLRDLGCPKINLQIRRDNLAAAAFYEELGFIEDSVVSYGKRLIPDVPSMEPPSQVQEGWQP